MSRRSFRRDEHCETGEGLSRRRFLRLSTGIAAGLLITPAHAGQGQLRRRALSLNNLHTGEKLVRTYWEDGEYLSEPLSDIDYLLRDYRTDDIHPIDPQLLDVLHQLQHEVGSRKAFEIISGYRSPKTNAMLRGNSSGVAKKSLHMQGKAIDIRLPGQDLGRLRQAALSLKAGGVGYYPKSNFLHIDTGRVRHWGK
ncbi:MAG: DUF882 domain-containing protein [Gammaproteobacteria bacterium]|nr:DUF882 domain-containing protein [Gammaproteobacteria bacterium]MCP5318425.1 DUF882 domain-containing protein [Chromatiaceae bacterium]MCW5585024.1 DUF882 domain-containing protein [Chromatiales bacterium]MCP5430986.1 DUF882 domain-containing protein [Chromatiaceae bacterium]HOP16186.1 DUF882 domain-containing protein [Gammaproteobacteria bacterium]